MTVRTPFERNTPVLVVLLACACAAAGALAATRGTTTEGVAYLEGGIGRPEIEALHQERAKYSLWIVTAARGSGAHMADVRLRMRDAQGRIAFERTLEGPWLLIDLPSGRYEIEASYEAQVLHRTVQVRSGRSQQAVFYFDVDGDVLP